MASLPCQKNCKADLSIQFSVLEISASIWQTQNLPFQSNGDEVVEFFAGNDVTAGNFSKGGVDELWQMADPALLFGIINAPRGI